MYCNNTIPVRSIADLRELNYRDMNSSEITKLQSEDPEAFKTVLAAVDGTPEPAAEVPSVKRTAYRNGQPYEIPAGASYINGIAVDYPIGGRDRT